LLSAHSDPGQQGLAFRLVVSRWLDLIFQYAFALVAAFLVLPLALAASSVALDRSQTATTRIWVDRPSFLSDLSSVGLAGGGTAAEGEATTIRELVHTDSFVDSIFTETDASYKNRSEDDQARIRAGFQAALIVSTDGPNVVVISYLSPTPATAVPVLNGLILSYGRTVEAILLGQVATTGSALDSQLHQSQQQMNDAVAQLNAYVRAHAKTDPHLLQTDPPYVTLSAQAQAKTSGYLSLLALSEEAQLAKSSIPSMRTSVFHVLDPPAVRPVTLTAKSPVVKALLGGFGGVALLEAMLIYVLAKRDPRVRSGEEVEERLGLRNLGSTPVLDRF
jgi:uncharacterized protein involved in exopolysaccharide biosynthesis